MFDCVNLQIKAEFVGLHSARCPEFRAARAGRRQRTRARLPLRGQTETPDERFEGIASVECASGSVKLRRRAASRTRTTTHTRTYTGRTSETACDQSGKRDARPEPKPRACAAPRTLAACLRAEALLVFG